MVAYSYATTAAGAGTLKRSLNATGKPAKVFFAITYVLYVYDRLAEYLVNVHSSKAMSAPNYLPIIPHPPPVIC